MIVVQGLREHKNYLEIAQSLRDDFHARAGARGKSVHKLIFELHNGIDHYLRVHGMQDEVEIEEIVSHYKNTRAPDEDEMAEKAATPKVPRVPPRTSDPVTERDRLKQLVDEGIKANHSLALIAVLASREHQIETDLATIERLIFSYRSIEGFLEHMGASKVEAVEIAGQYSSSRKNG